MTTCSKKSIGGPPEPSVPARGSFEASGIRSPKSRLLGDEENGRGVEEGRASRIDGTSRLSGRKSIVCRDHRVGRRKRGDFEFRKSLSITAVR